MFMVKMLIGPVTKCMEKRTPPLHKVLAEYPQMTFDDHVTVVRDEQQEHLRLKQQQLDDINGPADAPSFDGNQTADHSCISEHERCLLFLEMIQQMASTQRVMERDKFQRNALHIACLHHAPLEVIEYLVELYPEGVMEQDQVGRLPLHNACSNQAPLEVIQYLVEEYPEGVIETTMRGSIPLMCACEAGHPDPRVISYLIDQDPESILCTAPDEITPSKADQNSIVDRQGDSRREITGTTDRGGVDGDAGGDGGEENNKKPDKAMSYKLGKTPLHAACTRGVSLDIIQLLIHANSRLIYAQDSWGRTPLYCACTNPRIDIDTIDYMLSILSNNTVQQPDRSGQLPIHAVCAAANANINEDYLIIVEAILDSYPYAVQMKDKNGRVALHAALSNGHATVELIDMLVNTFPDALQIVDIYGQLPLHMALQRKNSLEVIQYLINLYPESIRKREWKMHRLPFHIACSVGSRHELLEYLLSLHPKAIAKHDKDYNTALNLACTSMELTKKSAKWLLEVSPPDVCDHINHYGSTVLHIACSNKIKLSILYMLLDRNPKMIQMVDQKDRYPIHRAFMVRTPITILVRLAQMYPEAMTKRDHQRYQPTDYASDDVFKAFNRARTSYNLRHAYAPCCIKEKQLLEQDRDVDDEIEQPIDDEEVALMDGIMRKDPNTNQDHTQSSSTHENSNHGPDETRDDNNNNNNNNDDPSKYTMGLNPFTGRSERILIT